MRIKEKNMRMKSTEYNLSDWCRGSRPATSVGALALASLSGIIGMLSVSSLALAQEEKQIRLCNNNDEGVYVAVAYEPTAGAPLMSRGWWTIDAQGCVDLKFPLGSDKILVHGESVSHVHQWRGDQTLCVDGTNKFDFTDAATRPCDTGDLSKRQFKQLSITELTALASGGTPRYDFNTNDAVNLGPILRVCNDADKDVYLSYAQRKAGSPDFTARGWFKINPNKCYETLRLPETNELLIYANGNDDLQIWSGTEPVCTDHYDGYDLVSANTRNCDALNQRRELFRKISLEGYTDFEYHLRPQDATSMRSSVAFCNNSATKIDLAILYKTIDIPDQMISEGWFTIDANTCIKPFPINAESVYVYAEDEEFFPVTEGSFAACVDLSKGFQFAKSTTMTCTGGSLTLVDFLEKPIPAGLSSISLP